MRELIVHLTIKTKDGRKLKVKALIDSECTNTTIARKTVEEKRISTKYPSTYIIQIDQEMEKRQLGNLYLWKST